jgi:hypothetical protein
MPLRAVAIDPGQHDGLAPYVPAELDGHKPGFWWMQAPSSTRCPPRRPISFPCSEAAIDDDNTAIKLEPADAYALYAPGLAELRQGAMTRGQSDLAAASELQPGTGPRCAGMGLTPGFQAH